jgi:hypothetical protein
MLQGGCHHSPCFLCAELPSVHPRVPGESVKRGAVLQKAQPHQVLQQSNQRWATLVSPYQVRLSTGVFQATPKIADQYCIQIRSW